LGGKRELSTDRVLCVPPKQRCDEPGSGATRDVAAGTKSGTIGYGPSADVLAIEKKDNHVDR
jgi:hypothetical protein